MASPQLRHYSYGLAQLLQGFIHGFVQAIESRLPRLQHLIITRHRLDNPRGERTIQAVVQFLVQDR